MTESIKLINADAKEAELRGKLLRYMNMEQTPEVQECMRMIRRCIAELRDTKPYEMDSLMVFHLNEEVIRCFECRYFERDGCRHSRGMLGPKADSFCSEGVRRCEN